jgi:hypothetical protein
MTQNNQNIDQLVLYKEIQKSKYEKHLREKYLHEKIKKFAESSPTERAANVINKAIRKHLLPIPINADALPSIPGHFRQRLQMTEINTFPLEIQKEIFNNATQGNDANTSKAIIDSLKESYAPLYCVVIDLRIYGLCPEMGISESDQMLYLTEDQINKTKNAWDRVNPDTPNGIRFQQLLDSSRTLATLYGLSKTINY